MDSLGISDELKDKLEDVLIPEQQFTLGRMLGKGMWGCVGTGMSRVCCVWVCLVASITLRVWIWVSSYKQDRYAYRFLSFGVLGGLVDGDQEC